MTLTPTQRLLLVLLVCFMPTSGFSAEPYWLPKTQGLNLKPEITGPTLIQALPAADLSAGISTWKSNSTGQTASHRWNEEASRLIVKYRLNALRSVRTLAYLHIAMHDAGLRADALGLKQSAQSAATHIAASNMLTHFFPLESPGRIEAMGESALATLTKPQSDQARDIAQAATIGRSVSRLAMLRALNDGADEVWDPRTRPVDQLGMWQGTPPLDSAHPQEPLGGTWRTWVLKNGKEFQPPAPPTPDSEVFQRAAKEVLEVGRHLTSEQKQIATYWHLDQGSVTPPGLWNLKARELAEKRDLAEKERLRLFSMLNVAMQDASITCWHAKFTWWVQRPYTMIHTNMDKTFTPYLVTPPHPSYISGHATVSGAAAEILKHFFQNDSRQIDAWAEEAALSRLYGGIHYRFDNEAGLALGRQIGKVVLDRTLPEGK